mmetsp:Transcript_26063/g.40779  ORF Transcript_26063/g.40779 Transcript_26063/m.40779 type:complete len:231 (-) Transcript_26063:1386-2078(-)
MPVPFKLFQNLAPGCLRSCYPIFWFRFVVFYEGSCGGRESPVSKDSDNLSFSMSTTKLSPSPKSPCKIPLARGVSSSRRTARCSGRTPYTGSYPMSAMKDSAASEHRMEMFLSLSLLFSTFTCCLTIRRMSSLPSELNMICSSSLFKNSGRKRRFISSITRCLISWSVSGVPPSSKMTSDPMFDVKMMMVFLKLTVRPCPSVTRPSSRTCSKTLNTSGCAFSISSKRTTE